MRNVMKRIGDNEVVAVENQKNHSSPAAEIPLIEHIYSNNGKILLPTHFNPQQDEESVHHHHQQQIQQSTGNNNSNRNMNRRARRTSNRNRMGRDALALLEQSITAAEASLAPTKPPGSTPQALAVPSLSSSSSSSSSTHCHKQEEDKIDDTRYYCSNLLILAEQQVMESNYHVAKELYSLALRYQRADMESSNEYTKEMISSTVYYQTIPIFSIDYEELYDIASTLHSLGNVCYELMQYEEAKMYIKEAKQIKRQYYREISSQTHIMMKFKSAIMSVDKVEKRKQYNCAYSPRRHRRGLSRNKSSCHNLLEMSLALETTAGCTDLTSSNCFDARSSTDETYRGQQKKKNDIFRYSDIYYNSPKNKTSMATNSHNDSNLDIASTLDDLGKACYALHEYDQASKYYKEAVDIKRIWYAKHQTSLTNNNHNYNHDYQHHSKATNLSTGKPESSSSSSSLSSMNFMMPNDESKLVTTLSTSLPDAALFLMQRRYGYNHKTASNVDIAYTLHRLGEIAYAMGKYHKARNKYVQALEMYQEHCNNHCNTNKSYKPNHHHFFDHDKTINTNTAATSIIANSRTSNNDGKNNDDVDTTIITLLMQLCQINLDMKHMKYAQYYYNQVEQKHLLLLLNNQQQQQMNELSNQVQKQFCICKKNACNNKDSSILPQQQNATTGSQELRL